MTDRAVSLAAVLAIINKLPDGLGKHRMRLKEAVKALPGVNTQADVEAAVLRAVEWAADHCYDHDDGQRIRAITPDQITKIARGDEGQ